MVQMNLVLIAVTALLASSALLSVSDGAKKLLLLTSCIPTKCMVCEKLTLQLCQLVKEKQVELLLKKISEYEIIEIAENVCNLKKEEADWMLKIDVVEKDDKLQLIEQKEEWICNSKYKTIESACLKGLTDACIKNSPGESVMKVYSREDIKKYEKMIDEARHEIDVLVSMVEQNKKQFKNSMIDWEMRDLTKDFELKGDIVGISSKLILEDHKLISYVT